MGRGNILVGLEIGTSKVCVVVGEADADGPIKILGVGQAPSRGVRKGEIVDFETAHKCVREALADAEEKSDVEIRSVFVGVSGSHIQSFNNRGSFTLPEERDEIEESDYEHVALSARDVNIPPQNAFLHTLLLHYYVDGQDGVLNPIGMYGRQLEADFHIIHGVSNRIKNTLRCVKEIGLEVDDVVFNGIASAQVVLSQQQKDLGAMVIDMGGGTSDYVVYVDGAVQQSGVLGIGGDHITNDISMGLRIPMAKAERLKVDEGDVTLGNALPEETISLKDETGFAGREIEREMLNTIIHMRVRETFEMIKRVVETEPYLPMLGSGVFLSGGCSLLRGIGALAHEVFGVPIHVAHAQATSGLTAASENPQFASAIGLLRYGQATLVLRRRKNSPLGWLKDTFKDLFGKH